MILLITTTHTFLQHASTAIQCRFRFRENVDNYPQDEELKLVESPIQNSSYSNLKPFDCDEPQVTTSYHQVLFASKIDVVGRVNDFFEDDYESVPVCETRNRTIRPKAMSSVNNQMIPVVNTNEVIQSINTEECL